jgi:hypothetical protein
VLTDQQLITAVIVPGRLRSYRKKSVQVASRGQPAGRGALGLSPAPSDITRTKRPALQIIPLGAAWQAMHTGPGQRQNN